MKKSAKHSEAYPVGLLFFTLLPMLLFWRCYSVFSGVLGVQQNWGHLDHALCFVQDLAVWSVAYLICRKFVSPGCSTARIVTIIGITQSLLILQIVDARIKIKFLEPLSFDLIHFSFTEVTTLASGFSVFMGPSFWKVAMLFVFTLLGISMLLFVLRRYDWTSAGNEIFSARFSKALHITTAPVAVALVIAGTAVSPKAYSLHGNFIFTALTAPVIKERVPGHRNHAQYESPEPLRQSSIEDFAHATDSRIAVAKGYNVILFVLESTPAWAVAQSERRNGGSIFSDLRARGAYYSEAYSSFATSTKSMFTLLSGLYASPTNEVIAANVQKLPGLPRTLKEAGYYTEFLSSQGLHFQGERDIYKSLGYDQIKGEPELVSIAAMKGMNVEQDDFAKGNDRLMFVEGFSRLKQQQPFMTTFYSAATHWPYDYPGSTPGTDEERHQRAMDYSESVIRELLTALKDLKLDQNTLVIITSDHGEEFVDGSFKARGTTLTERTHRVPLLIYAPDKPIKAPATGFSRHVDVMPTVLDLLGITALDKPLQGHSMIKDIPQRTAYLNATGRVNRAASVTGSRKLIHSFDTGKTQMGELRPHSREPIYAALETTDQQDSVRSLLNFAIYNEALLRDMSEAHHCVSPLLPCNGYAAR